MRDVADWVVNAYPGFGTLKTGQEWPLWTRYSTPQEVENYFNKLFQIGKKLTPESRAYHKKKNK